MLSRSDVFKLFEEGIEIKFLKETNPESLRGEFIPLEVRVFLSAHTSALDRKITLLHELIHARDSMGNYSPFGETEETIHGEAVMTYFRRSYVFTFIKNLYGIKEDIFN